MVERIYTINLRREFQKAPRYRKSSKSIRAIKEFVKKHMKTKEVSIGKYLNQEVWKNGPKNPPAKVNVKIIKEEEKAIVELVGAPEEVKKEEPKKKGLKEKLEEKTKKEVKEEIKEELKTSMDKKTAEKVAEEVVEESKKEITKDIPKKKVPTTHELKAKKTSKK